jgi:hypothetical protein
MGGGYVARIGEIVEYIGFWWGNLRESNNLQDPHLEGRIIIKRIFKI